MWLFVILAAPLFYKIISHNIFSDIRPVCQLGITPCTSRFLREYSKSPTEDTVSLSECGLPTVVTFKTLYNQNCINVRPSIDTYQYAFKGKHHLNKHSKIKCFQIKIKLGFFSCQHAFNRLEVGFSISIKQKLGG